MHSQGEQDILDGTYSFENSLKYSESTEFSSSLDCDKYEYVVKIEKKYTQKEYDNPAVAMIAIIRFVGVLKICPSFIFIDKFIWSSFSFFESMDL